MRMIDANALKTSFEEDGHLSNYIEEFIDNAPTIDAEPVRHGRWIRRKSCHTQTGFVDKCSVCQNMLVHLGCKANYCPNCGAMMDGGKDDENA